MDNKKITLSDADWEAINKAVDEALEENAELIDGTYLEEDEDAE